MRRRTLLGTAPLAALGLAGCLNTGPSSGSPSRTDSPDGTPTEDPSPATAWTASLDGSVTHAPAVSGDSVYTGTESGQFHSLAVADGRERWTTALGDPLASHPVHDDGAVFLVAGTQEFSADQRVLAIDAGTGEELWRFSPGGWWLTLHAVDDGTVYVSTRDDALSRGGETLHAVDRADGSEQWQAEVGDSYASAFTEDTVAVATYGRLYAFDRSDGSERWHVGVEDVDSPRATGGTIFARVGLGEDAHVRAYDARSGEEQWRFGEWSVASLTLDGGLYAGGGRLGRVALDSGDPAWRTDGEAFVPQVPVADGRIFAGGDGVAAYATDSGEEAWTFTPEQSTATHTGGPGNEPVPEILVPETVADGAVLVRGAGNSASQRRASALATDDGQERWTWVADGELTELVGEGDRAYAGSEDGTVHAFDPSA